MVTRRAPDPAFNRTYGSIRDGALVLAVSGIFLAIGLFDLGPDPNASTDPVILRLFAISGGILCVWSIIIMFDRINVRIDAESETLVVRQISAFSQTEDRIDIASIEKISMVSMDAKLAQVLSYGVTYFFSRPQLIVLLSDTPNELLRINPHSHKPKTVGNEIAVALGLFAPF